MVLFQIENLSKSYQGKHVVKEVNCQLLKGKCIALIGPNGAGKTTTLRMLAGLIKPSSGSMTILNKEGLRDIRSHIGYLPQHPVFYSWMTGLEFLVYSGQLSYLSKKEAGARAEVLLEKVGIMDAKDRRIETYSGGMKQRLGIAQAIIHQPSLLLLDEPVSALDPLGRRDVLTLMEELKRDMTILFSTHILSDADEISDELLLMHHGEIVESGSLSRLREKYQTAAVELRFQERTKHYLNKIKTLPSVQHVYVERDTVHMTVAHIDRARKEILAVASEENWPLIGFSVHTASLEDMFMRVVKN